MNRFIPRSVSSDQNALAALRQLAVPIYNLNDLEPLIAELAHKRVVMLGEASHGTHEYYTWRNYISSRLIAEHGFHFIAVEGDWPGCFRINEFVKSATDDVSCREVLATFHRWPAWMWANWEVAAFVDWLKGYNLQHSYKAGFYGLDLYSLWESLASIMQYLSKTDPGALEKAAETFRCFEPYKEDGLAYGHASRLVPERCEEEVLELLREVQPKTLFHNSGVEQVFSAEQNALVAVNAEQYYRSMVRADAASWNIRDNHMQDTLSRLLDFHGPVSKAIVWAHNTHIGDASATDMQAESMTNLGELSRKAFGADTYLVGFGSYSGSVIAAKKWGAPMQVMAVPEAAQDSWEFCLHNAGHCNMMLFTTNLRRPWQDVLGHRAVGVVYRPEREQYGNYVPTMLSKRYDGFIFIDRTTALHPLHPEPLSSQLPDTYPFGL